MGGPDNSLSGWPQATGGHQKSCGWRSSSLALKVVRDKLPLMKLVAFTYWKDGNDWLGFLNAFPDYLTQGKSFVDLQDHLMDLYRDLKSKE
jgi:hypothetical protein